jgi:hypothetical protein
MGDVQCRVVNGPINIPDNEQIQQCRAQALNMPAVFFGEGVPGRHP